MATMKIQKGENNARELLLSLGMGHYNATIAIQYKMLAPASTDPAMPSIILMTKHLQLGLRAAGANIPVTGQFDDPTVEKLIVLVGPEWHHVTWYALFQSVIAAKREQVLEQASAVPLPVAPADLGDVSFLPSVPGGMFTYAVAAVAAWYLLFRKKH
jgi:hypothetical protein